MVVAALTGGDRFAGRTLDLGTNLDGRNAVLSEGVREALGRDPRDFADFAGEQAEAGTWKN